MSESGNFPNDEVADEVMFLRHEVQIGRYVAGIPSDLPLPNQAWHREEKTRAAQEEVPIHGHDSFSIIDHCKSPFSTITLTFLHFKLI